MRLSLSLTALGLLAACGPGGLPAGSQIERADFGVATRNALAVQAGEIGALTAIRTRFARLVPTAVFFPFDSAALTPDAVAVLDAQAHFMGRFPELRFHVVGHTDLVGSNAYNEGLGRRRAEAAAAYLVSRGVPTGRLATVTSQGETRPVVPVQGPIAVNRRAVTVVVAGFVADHPAVLDGRYARIVYRDYLGSAGRFADAGLQTEGAAEVGTIGSVAE